VPLFILDTPFCHTEYTEEMRKYVRRQIDEYLRFLEEHCGKKYDYDRMKEVGKLSVTGQKLWQAVLDTTMHKPAPMSAFDAFFHLALIVTLRGTQQAVDYYEMLLAEMKKRIANGIGAIPNERYRLLWDNLPVWYRRSGCPKNSLRRTPASWPIPIHRPGAVPLNMSMKTIFWKPWPNATPGSI